MIYCAICGCYIGDITPKDICESCLEEQNND